MKHPKRLNLMIVLSWSIVFALPVIACGSIGDLFATPTPIATKTPTATPTLTPTQTPTPMLTPRPTSVPGAKFQVTTGEVTLELKAPSCGILSLGFGGKKIEPLASDSQLCFLTGDVVKGMPSQSDVNTWVDSGGVYLLDQSDRKGQLIYVSVSTEKRTVFWIFSAPNDYSAIQLQLLDQLIDLP